MYQAAKQFSKYTYFSHIFYCLDFSCVQQHDSAQNFPIIMTSELTAAENHIAIVLYTLN